MFTLVLNSSAADVVAIMRDEKRRRWAIANAINKTALKIQEREVDQFRSRFIVRPERKTFMEKQVAIIKPFAKEARLEAHIRVGQKPRLLLSEFEAGGKHESSKGPGVAVPITGQARVTIQANITPELLYKALGMKKVVSQYRGKLRTWAIDGIGVFQRTGPGSDYHILYAFKSSTPLKARLGFTKLGEAVAMEVWNKAMSEEIAGSLDHALSKMFRFNPMRDDSGD
jgi:hypothetical protein